MNDTQFFTETLVTVNVLFRFSIIDKDTAIVEFRFAVVYIQCFI